MGGVRLRRRRRNDRGGSAVISIIHERGTEAAGFRVATALARVVELVFAPLPVQIWVVAVVTEGVKGMHSAGELVVALLL